MDIVVNSKGLRNTAFAFLVLLAGIAALFATPLLHTPGPQDTSQIPQDAMAAVKAVTAFYTLDYTEPPNLWTSRVCAHATQKGCQAIRDFFAPSVQAAVDEHRVQTYAMVEPVQVVTDFEGRRIWKLEVTLTNPRSDETVGAQDCIRRG